MSHDSSTVISNNPDVFQWTLIIIGYCLSLEHIHCCDASCFASPNHWCDLNFILSILFPVQMRLFILDIADRRGSDLAACPQHIVSVIRWNSYNIESRCCAKDHKSGRKWQEVAPKSTFTSINGREMEGLRHFQVIIGQRNEWRGKSTQRQGGKLPNKTGSDIWTPAKSWQGALRHSGTDGVEFFFFGSALSPWTSLRWYFYAVRDRMRTRIPDELFSLFSLLFLDDWKFFGV